jgi:hypothetical protein
VHSSRETRSSAGCVSRRISEETHSASSSPDVRPESQNRRRWRESIQTAEDEDLEESKACNSASEEESDADAAQEDEEDSGTDAQEASTSCSRLSAASDGDKHLVSTTKQYE